MGENSRKSLLCSLTTMSYRHGVAWGNPYTAPPNNLPRVLLSVQSKHHRPNEKTRRKQNAIIDRLRAKGIWGFHLTFDSSDKPVKRWSDEAKHRNRLKRLKQRLSKEYSIPEFYESALSTELNKNPSYYGLKP